MSNPITTTHDLDPALQAELDAEREFHNRVYKTSTPFDLSGFKIDPGKVLEHLQPMYVSDGHSRGNETVDFSI